MPVQGTFPIAQMPLLPNPPVAEQEQKSGVVGIADRTIDSPADFLTITAGGISVVINPSMMGPQDVQFTLSNAGIAATLDRYGRLVLPDVASVSGNATLKTALGLP